MPVTDATGAVPTGTAPAAADRSTARVNDAVPPSTPGPPRTSIRVSSAGSDAVSASRKR